MKRHILAFRGAQLNEAQMNIWMNQGLKDNKEKVAIPSMLSTSENIQVALRYA